MKKKNNVKYIDYDDKRNKKNKIEKIPGYIKPIEKGGVWVEGTSPSGERISMPDYFYNPRWHPELF